MQFTRDFGVRLAILASVLSLFAFSASARVSLAADRGIGSPVVAVGAERAAAPPAAGIDVPEPATYIIVGTVLIALSITGHVLRRRRITARRE